MASYEPPRDGYGQEPARLRTSRLSTAAVLGLAAAVIAGPIGLAIVGQVIDGDRGPGNLPGGQAATAVATSSPARPSVSPAPVAIWKPSPKVTPTLAGPRPSGTVFVDVHLAGASGTRVAAFLVPGVPGYSGGDSPADGVGGLSADVTSDDFILSGLIRELPPGDPWPDFAARPAVLVAPGIYTIVVWVSEQLRPWADTLPDLPIDGACSAFLTVREGRQTTVKVAGPDLSSPGLTVPLPVCSRAGL